VCHLDSLL